MVLHSVCCGVRLSCWVYLQVPRKLTLHSLVMEQLLSLDLIPPSSVADIPKVLQELHAKKVLCACHCSLLIVHCPLFCSLFIVHCPLFGSLFIVRCSLVHCPLFIVHCSLSIVYCLLFIVHCLLSVIVIVIVIMPLLLSSSLPLSLS